MRLPATPGRAALWVFAVGALLRLAFVGWAPRELSGDGLHYHMGAVAIATGHGYTDLDGSPSIRWMPGWPYLLAGLYSAFGLRPGLAMAANALAGGATAGLLVLLGHRLLGLGVGAIAGLLYAVWPGNVYYTATLMTEPVFSLLLVACLLALVRATRQRAGRDWPWLVGAGAALGAMALVKAEPLILIPLIALLLFTTTPSWARAVGSLALVLAVAAALLAPWVWRNHRAFDRLLVTTATGGANAWLGNHPGASGGQSIVEMRAFMARHRGADTAETLFEASRTGWREAAAFVRERPGEWARIAAHKLRLTYGSDGHGARLVRGAGVGRVGFLREATRERLERIADLYWYGVLALAGVGLAGVGGWSRAARIVVLGLPLTWLCTHLVFLGGPRFHVPETPALALAAACGARLLAALGRGRPLRAAVSSGTQAGAGSGSSGARGGRSPR